MAAVIRKKIVAESSAAAGTVINRFIFGDVAEFALPGTGALEFYFELPAYLLLGLVCGGDPMVGSRK